MDEELGLRRNQDARFPFGGENKFMVRVYLGPRSRLSGKRKSFRVVLYFMSPGGCSPVVGTAQLFRNACTYILMKIKVFLLHSIARSCSPESFIYIHCDPASAVRSAEEITCQRQASFATRERKAFMRPPGRSPAEFI